MTFERNNKVDKNQELLKQKIMEDLLSVLFGNLQRNSCLFDVKSLLDFTFSILIMFNREILVHSFTTMHITHHRKDIMRDLFETIKTQVNMEIKDKLN